MCKRWYICAFVALSAIAFAVAVPASARDDDDTALKLAKIKSAYVLNFLKYTQWPESAFDDSKSIAPIVLVVLGDDQLMDRVLDKTLERSQAGNRAIEVVHTTLPRPPERFESDDQRQAFEKLRSAAIDRIRSAHAVFVCRDTAAGALEIIRGLDGLPLLTIGDQSQFAENGGMLSLAVRDNRVVFDANPAAIRHAEIQVSAHVLRLARIVKGDEGGGR